MSRGKIINIDWNSNSILNCSLAEASEVKKVWLKEEARRAATEGYDIVIAILLVDGLLGPHPEFFSKEIEVFKTECSKLGIKKCILLSGQGGTYFPTDLAFDEILSIDYTLHFTYNSYKDKIDNNLLPTYKPNNKFLFLGGAPARHNRIGLLYEFYQKGMLKNDTAVWSFFKPTESAEESLCRELLNDISDSEYYNFINYAERRFDDLYYNLKNFFANSSDWQQILNQEWVKRPALIDSSVFKDSSISVISEGPNYWDHSNNNNFVTEKFWRTVLHNHPFVFSGNKEQYQLIKKLGFKTFEDYLEIPDYINIADQKKQNTAVVQNVQYFLKNQFMLYEQIEQDVNYNYNLLSTCIAEQIKILEKIQNEFYISHTQMDYYFNQTGYKTAIAVPLI